MLWHEVIIFRAKTIKYCVLGKTVETALPSRLNKGYLRFFHPKHPDCSSLLLFEHSGIMRFNNFIKSERDQSSGKWNRHVSKYLCP